MFIKTEKKSELIKELQKVEERLGGAVIHYNCFDCDDEQVTDELDIEQEYIDSFIDEGYILTHYGCTNCGTTTKFLYADNIQGIEIVDINVNSL